MFTDVFGYSKMVGKDEKHALSLLDEHNEIIAKSIDKHQGSIIKFIGDAVFAEFDMSNEAAHCAIEIQKTFIHRNKIHSKNDRIRIRIGLHMGNLVVKGDDLLGHVVNLGSRIEAVAPVDGIFISKPVHDAIKDDASIFTKEIGHVKMKNIKEPCKLFKLYLDQLNFTAQSHEALQKETLDRGVQVVDMDKYSPIDIYSIGMIYFKNLGKKEDEVSCRGIAQEIIKSMAGINALRMPSPTEIEQYEDINLPMSEIARRMQVDHMLFGSILKGEKEYELHLEMKNMTEDRQCFEKTFKFSGTEFNAIKGQILLKILYQFDLELPDHVEKSFQVQPTSNPKAMEHYIKGRHLIDIPKSSESMMMAREHFNKATELDPSFLYAHSNKGWISFLNGNYDVAEDEFFSALDLARQDDLDMSDAYVYGHLGTLYHRLEKHNKSIHYLEKALDIYLQYNNRRNIASTLHNLGHVFVDSEKIDDALDCFHRSLAIKEEFEDRNVLASSYNQIANAYYTKGDFTLSIENANRSIGYYVSIGNNLFGAYSMAIMADSLSKIGLFEEAEKHLSVAQEIFEEFSNLFLLGKVDVLRGMRCFNEGNLDEAIHLYKEGIEKIQMDESRRWVIHYSMELIHVLMYNEDYVRASKYVNRCQLMIKKTSGIIPMDRTLLRVIETCILIDEGKMDIEKLKSLHGELEEDEAVSYFGYYYLGKAFGMMHDENERKNCMKKARNLLDELVSNISDLSHRDSFKKNHLIHAMIFS